MKKENDNKENNKENYEYDDPYFMFKGKDNSKKQDFNLDLIEY